MTADKERGDEGFVLAAVLVMVFLVVLALTIAAPKIAMSIKRDREVESAHRAQQYVRAIRVYYKKFGHYPGSIDQLEKSNNQRFLRSKYVDPLTGKDDWRLIKVGENKTKVKGFFGEDLPGLTAGLGSAAGMSSSTNTTTGSSTSTSAFNNSTTSNSSSSSGGNNALGSASGMQSKDATDSSGGGGGPFMGVGSSKTGEAIVVVNEQTNYQDWEFLYDPRIEQLYAKGAMNGGIGTGTTGTGLPPGRLSQTR